MKDWQAWLARIGLAAVAVVSLALMTSILGTDSRIVVTPYESTAVAATGERLIQMAQWTIGLVLTVGGLLIGLNWYQNEKRYERDKQDLRDEIQSLRSESDRRYTGLESMVNAQLGMWMYQAVQRELGDIYDMTAGSRAVKLYRESVIREKRVAVAAVILGMAQTAASTDPTNPHYGHLRDFEGVVSDIRRDFPSSADELQSIIDSARQLREAKAGRAGPASDDG